MTLEVKQLAEKRMYAEADTNPQVDILWHTVPFGRKDSYPLEVLQQLLLGRTGRLCEELEVGRKVATSTWANSDVRKWGGSFNIGGEVRDGNTHDDVEKAIYEELERLNEAVPSEELQKVKNQFAAAQYRKLTANFPILMQLIQSEGLGDWREVNEAAPKYQAVTAEDLQRVAKKYFTRESRIVGIYSRKESGRRRSGPRWVESRTETGRAEFHGNA